MKKHIETRQTPIRTGSTARFWNKKCAQKRCDSRKANETKGQSKNRARVFRGCGSKTPIFSGSTQNLACSHFWAHPPPPSGPNFEKCAPNGPVLIGARQTSKFRGLPRNTSFWLHPFFPTFRLWSHNSHKRAPFLLHEKLFFANLATRTCTFSGPSSSFDPHSRDLAAQHTLFSADTHTTDTHLHEEVTSTTHILGARRISEATDVQ